MPETGMRKKVSSRPRSLTGAPFRYCPGCGHSIVHRLVAESIDALGIREKVIGIAPVGCAVFAYDYFDFDMIEAAHGRPPAVATGLKRTMPGTVVFTYQGDGDLAAIGTAEIIHAAARGENISVFFVNNATYGMTGGQMAPTTIPGQRTATTPGGRDIQNHGHPLRISELLATIDGSAYIERVSLASAANIRTARRAVEKSLCCQIDGHGFSMVEILSPCPTDWGMTPRESLRWMQTEMLNTFPLGIFRDRVAGVSR
ncbi:MAG: thiamine pyrophosphate-dependent enzyme [Nitrospiraceae bacterium]|nr:thiamine pyrophosphate-dependent enzyme [Nitrospiraceae bacterium]